MPANTAITRSSPFLALAEAPVPIPAEPPGGLGPLPPAPGFAVRPVLRVGDYEVGETFCPRLYGHPGIRY